MRRAIHFVLLGLVSGLLAWGIFSLGLFSGSERIFSDRLLPEFPLDSRIALIAIDNRTITELGGWPLPRARFGELIDLLGANAPASLGIDVMFSEPSKDGEADDAQLEAALRNASFPIVLPVEFDQLSFGGEGVKGSGLLRPRARFAVGDVRFGHVNVAVDPDGVVRAVPFSIDGVSAFASIVVGKNRNGTERIAFAGPRETVRTISFVDILKDPSVRMGLKGSYVFVGATAVDLHDEVETPHSGGAMSGAELHAQIANMLLGDHHVRSLALVQALFWLVLMALLGALPFVAARKASRSIALATAGLVAGVVVIILQAETGLIFPFIYTFIAWGLGVASAFLYRYRTLDNERRMIRETFGKFVSRDVLEEMLANPGKVRLGGEEREVTVFFSDVRGFTTLSEKLSPAELVAFLNRYLTRMTDIVLEESGVLDKYIGDAIMAFWGAPLKRETQAVDAARAALKMVDALELFNKEARENGELEIDIGIGLNAGKVIAGNMGSERRFDYTVMGDTVNLASRLEGQTKTYGVHILAAETVATRLPPEFMLREVDRIKVKGKNLPVTVFEIVENRRREIVQSFLPAFEAARTAYYAGDWKTAVERCDEILRTTDDGPTKVFKKRAEEFLVSPPDHWEGVYKLTSK